MEWITKCSRNRVRNRKWSVNDVSINVIKIGFSFIFRNNVSYKYGDAVVFAKVGNRIYFNGADSSEGYVLINTPNSITNRYVYLSSHDDINFLNDFVGDYNLQYDVENDLYFIENKSLEIKESED